MGGWWCQVIQLVDGGRGTQAQAIGEVENVQRCPQNTCSAPTATRNEGRNNAHAHART